MFYIFTIYSDTKHCHIFLAFFIKKISASIIMYYMYTIKAACLQMSKNISITSNLRKVYSEFRKSRKIQYSSNISHAMGDQWLFFHYV
jgi:hypothetical protein